MKSSIDFLVQRLAENGILHSSDIHKAKQMHKQEIEDAFNDGINDECLGKNTTPEEYYKNTYEKE